MNFGTFVSIKTSSKNIFLGAATTQIWRGQLFQILIVLKILNLYEFRQRIASLMWHASYLVKLHTKSKFNFIWSFPLLKEQYNVSKKTMKIWPILRGIFSRQVMPY